MARQPRLAPRYISLPNGAVYSGTSVRTLRRAIATGKLPAYRIPGTRVVRIDVADLDGMFQPVPNAGMFDDLDDQAQQ